MGFWKEEKKIKKHESKETEAKSDKTRELDQKLIDYMNFLKLFR